ncbi:hypothetical protein BH11ARM1_BH11ARM1_08380 [soil metagenome]
MASPCDLKTRWCLSATPTEIVAVLMDVETYPEWWACVFLESKLVDAGDTEFVGLRAEVLSRGYLSTPIKWQFVVVSTNLPHSVHIQMTGEAIGSGELRVCQEGDLSEVTFCCQIQFEESALQRMMPVLRPLIKWNHQWAMDQGQKCLGAELKRRRILASERVETTRI